MTRKRAKILSIICIIIGILFCVFIYNIGNGNLDFLISNHKEKSIEKFPSYDWDTEEGEALAEISANTDGTDFEKQMAIVECLREVWETQGHPTIIEYFNKNYSKNNLKKATKKDYLIVSMVVEGIVMEE